ncbi:hypothetical protein [Prescottella equi]|uniref:hypothetical protein n=1 Tax=Rhodococcus hoagii TaxID=43767 RepID=UPI0007CD44C6|nr:hypothetical protein [Prescottella equi]
MIGWSWSVGTTELFGVAQRTAMLTAVMRNMEEKAIDEALDLFQFLMASQRLHRRDDTTPRPRRETPAHT